MRFPIVASAIAALAISGLSFAAPAVASNNAPAITGVCVNPDAGESSSVVNGATFFVGRSGSVAILRASPTAWIHCNDNGTTIEFTLVINGVRKALTTRDFAPGGDVTLEQSNNFASQRWIWSGTNPYTFQNVKTGLFLRVRNSGPDFGQTVTTGHTPTSWNQS